MRLVAFAGWLVTVLLSMVDISVAAEPASVGATGMSSLRDIVAAAVARDVPFAIAAVQDAANLQLLDPSLSLPPDARLRVTSVRAGYSPGSWLLRLDCASRRDCLPFHVLLRAPAVDLNAQPTGKAPPNLPRTKSLVAHSGDHALLVEERSGLRLKVPVVCLQSGGLGDQVRVRNLATQRILVATVAGKNLVRVE